jgi:hypothetical protein
MGEVYRARDTRLGREVAIKVLPAERMADESRRRRFVQEARAASALNHPNICTIYDVDAGFARNGDSDPSNHVEEFRHFIAMELLEGETQKRLGATADYVVRSAEEWESIVARNPFPKAAKDDPSHLVVMCLKGAAQAKDVKALQAAIKGPELVRGDGMQLYITYPASIGTSKLTNVVIERTIGMRGTARNWNTVLKVAELIRPESR